MYITFPQDQIQLKKHDIHIWHINLEADKLKEDTLEACQQLLSEDEKERADRLRSSALRNHFILARGHLRKVLGKYLNQHPKKIVFTYNKHGKPLLENTSPTISFNVSHSQDLFLIALTLKRKIGIDIERTGRFDNWIEIAKHSLSQQEQSELFKLSKNEQEQAFIRGWTRKEAYTKALGLGLFHDFPDFSVTLNEFNPKIIFDPKNAQDLSTWKLLNIKVDAPCFASLAVDCQSMDPESPDLLHFELNSTQMID